MAPHSTSSEAACAAVPMQLVGPLKLTGPVAEGETMLPLATFESALWPSVNRGAAVTRQAGGIAATLVSDCMTRSVLVEAPDAAAAVALRDAVEARRAEVADVVAGSSRFCRLKGFHWEFIGNLIYLRLAFTTGDAAGHNMTTLAADRVIGWLLTEYPQLRYGSISANLCTDKKVSAANRLLGRGKHVIAEALLPARLVSRYLKTTAPELVALHQRKNLLGSILAGSLESANAHAANMLLALYLATGQDAANLVEGSQAIVHAEVRDDDLYFSVSVPNLIVGTVGNGKHLPFVQENLRLLGCLEERPAGANAQRLAAIAAGTVLCGELSLLAAQTNPGELMRAHLKYER